MAKHSIPSGKSRSGLTASPTGAAAPAPQSAADTKDFQELTDYMKNELSIRVAPNLAAADFESVREAAQNMEELLKEFPQITDVVYELNGTAKRGYASATYDGYIQLNPDKFTVRRTAEDSYQRDLLAKFHPKGTSVKNISDHEMGHLLERALIEKHLNAVGGTRWEGISAWNNSRFAKAVISEASRAAKKTPDGKGLKVSQLITNVSRYAEKNRSETLAECVADYRANGQNATALSREVWKILKRELG